MREVGAKIVPTPLKKIHSRGRGALRYIYQHYPPWVRHNLVDAPSEKTRGISGRNLFFYLTFFLLEKSPPPPNPPEACRTVESIQEELERPSKLAANLAFLEVLLRTKAHAYICVCVPPPGVDE